MSAVEDAIKKMNAQWWVALTTQAKLPENFQTAQGALSFGTESSKVWEKFDAIPPVSISRSFEVATLNSLGQNYSAVVNNLIPQNSDVMQQNLGDQYVPWQNFRSENPLPADTDWSDPAAIHKAEIGRFRQWASTAPIDQGQINAGVTILNQTDIVSTAQEMLVAVGMNEKHPNVLAYTASISDLQSAIDRGQQMSVDMNSATASSDISHSWAKVSASGFFRFFSGGGSSSWDQWTLDASSAGFEFEVNFNKLATLPGGPYANNSNTDINLVDYTTWFNSSALKTAQANNNNKVWQRGAPTWEQTFGENGNLKYITTNLVAVDGIETSLTTRASVEKSRREEFRAAASGGVWPFFSASGEGGFETETTFSDDGSVRIKTSSKEGNINLLGAIVSDIDRVIG